MSEMDSGMDAREAKIDGLLRRSMVAPVPSLRPDFDKRVLRQVREAKQGAGPMDRYRRILLAGYGVVSVAASAVVMRGQGLEWGATAGMILVPLALAAAAGPIWRARNAEMRQS